MQAREQCQRAGAIMHDYRNVVELCQPGNVVCLRNPPHPCRVNHDVICRSFFQRQPIVIGAAEHLTDGNGDACMFSEIGQGIDRIDAQQVFRPENIVLT